MNEQAAAKFTEFIMGSSDADLQHMTLDLSMSPPPIIFEDGERFVAMDPANNRFFIDKGYSFEVPYKFSDKPEVDQKVNHFGQVLIHRLREDALSSWVSTII